MTTLVEILASLRDGNCSVEAALEQLQVAGGEALNGIFPDHSRALRTGIPEVIYGASKSSDQIITACRPFFERKSMIMVTRVDAEKAEYVLKILPQLQYHRHARILSANTKEPGSAMSKGKIVIVSAGTSDMAVAEEARITAESLGHPVTAIHDVGVAGLHRLLSHQATLASSAVIIVVAGMEGALPSVVAGLVSAPVIGVPTSIGYGSNLGGFTALLAMLNSCAPGLAVVNIDNGFGAACMAVAINRK